MSENKLEVRLESFGSPSPNFTNFSIPKIIRTGK